MLAEVVYHYAAELFGSNFYSFEARIANAICSFKWRKICIQYLWKIMKNRHL